VRKNTCNLLKDISEINQPQGVALLEDLTKAIGARSKMQSHNPPAILRVSTLIGVAE